MNPAPWLILDVTGDLDPKEAFDPTVVEASWNDWWEASGFYTCDAEKAAKASFEDKFIMVIPPPNVTGSLHIGHALTVAIEDTITRWNRMRGKLTMWLPGTDHAGIATQAVVEKKLMKEKGIKKQDLGREKFVEEVWKWKEEYGNRITMQIRRLGSSVDWSREAFTMDEQLSRAVKEAFVRMYDDGLIYRASRLVNWSTALRTCISDIEVDYEELTDRTLRAVPGHDPAKKYEFGVITSFAYKVEDSDEEIVVATTRLETMLGDTAVAVHPKDPRYAHLHDKKLVHPFSGRRIPIVLDDVLVDMNFGTGAVKITPAHDPNDFACGRRHGLPEINIFTDTGEINAEGGALFQGMMRFDAREAVEAELKKLGLYRDKKPNPMKVPLCSRSGDVIEPRIKMQWFCDCKGMAKAATDAVRAGDLEIIPKDPHEDTWFRWLDNIRDWCISRQLWWGHRIPAYVVTVGGKTVHEDGRSEAWVVGRSEEEARANAAEKYKLDAATLELRQDEDVLDTWFSSGLFPFSVFGWPDKDSVDLGAFYPGHLLETGSDIIFFWVARMVMMGLQLTGTLPFKQVYLHAMVRDKNGRKMSKSRGNVIDPLDVIEGCPLQELKDRLTRGNLPEKEIKLATKTLDLDFPQGIERCGTDALRFGLLAYTIQGRDINLDILRVVGWRQFCNKLWNATKFCMQMLKGYTPEAGVVEILSKDFAGLSSRDQWILGRLDECAAQCNELMATYAFARVATSLHNFWLKYLCDVYVELTKPILNSEDPAKAAEKRSAQRTLYVCVEHGLRLLHPMMPFVTEELWQRLLVKTGAREAPGGADIAQTIMLAPYPEAMPAWRSPDADAAMEVALDCIRAARALKTSYKLVNKQKPEVFLVASAAHEAHIARHRDDIATLAKVGDVAVVGSVDKVPDGCGCEIIGDGLELHLMLKGLVNVDAEVKKLGKDAGIKQKTLDSLQKKMSGAEYTTKVPEKVREQNKVKFETLTKEIAAINSSIERMKRLA